MTFQGYQQVNGGGKKKGRKGSAKDLLAITGVTPIKGGRPD